MSHVASKRLGDLINLKRGYDFPENQRRPGPYPVISSAGITGYHDEYMVEGTGVVTGRYGTIGEMYYVDGKYWPHNTALYVTTFKGNYPKYIYYLLSCLGRIRTSDKSAVPGVNRNELHEMAIPAITNKNQQKKIAAVLSALDAKIDCNNRINTELEAMAKTLYDYWFVQFDFPDANGKPYGYMAIARIELTTNQGFKSFSPTNGYSTAFIYYTVKDALKTITQCASGSTFKEVSGTVLKTVKITLPSSEIIGQFTNTVAPIFKRQDLLEQENQHLAQLRDWLLPMLMNGQVTVA